MVVMVVAILWLALAHLSDESTLDYTLGNFTASSAMKKLSGDRARISLTNWTNATLEQLLASFKQEAKTAAKTEAALRHAQQVALPQDA